MEDRTFADEMREEDIIYILFVESIQKSNSKNVHFVVLMWIK